MQLKKNKGVSSNVKRLANPFEAHVSGSQLWRSGSE